MTKVGIFKLAFTFIGSILGAGFVSGQELWLYFGCYGKEGLFGLFLSLFLLALACAAVLIIAGRTGDSTIDLILFSDRPGAVLREGVGMLFVLFYFCISVVMIAGISSLGKKLLGIPGPVCGALSTVLIMLVAWKGLSGMTGMFSILVPVLVVSAIVISIIRIASVGPHRISFPGGSANALLGNFLLSSVNYTGLNVFGAIGIIAPLAPYLKNKKTIPAGMVAGGIGLMLIAFAIVFALAATPASVTEDLPMLSLSVAMGPAYALVYGVLLFFGMFGSGFSCMVAVSEYLKVKYPKLLSRPFLFLCILGLTAYLLSLFGFSDLVGVIYPIMGYVGIASLVLIYYRVLSFTRAAAP